MALKLSHFHCLASALHGEVTLRLICNLCVLPAHYTNLSCMDVEGRSMCALTLCPKKDRKWEAYLSL